MARYKIVGRSPRFLPIVRDAQLMAGSFEYALDYLIDNEVDLTGIARRYCNDETGAPAYDPAVMLKIVLLAYSRGIVSSRGIERVCRENVLFMAISGDSAKMATAKGVIQGYAPQEVPLGDTAVAAVDGQSQIIVAAQAHGSGSEQSVLLRMVKLTEALRTAPTIITADAGYHSEANLQALHAAAVPALIADGLMRRRDERFAKQDRYRALPDPLYDKSASGKPSTAKFEPGDFTYDAAANTCLCPAGKNSRSPSRQPAWTRSCSRLP